MKKRGSAITLRDTSPAGTRKPPALVIMVGPPGTGKSYLVRRLAERVPLDIVETDDIRRNLTAHPTYTPAENRQVFLRAHARIDQLLRQGKNVVFDATNIYERGRRNLYGIADRNKARMLLVRTVAPDEVVAARLQKRKEGASPADRSEAGWEVFLRMKAQFEEIQRPHMVVDTSQELLPAIEEIARFLQDDQK